MATESTATPAQQIAAGYAVGGAALELGAVVVDAAVRPGRAGPHPAGDRQPSRAGRRRHRYREDEVAAGAGRTALRGGRAVLMADVKGDLSGLSRPGEANDKVADAGHRHR